MSLLQLLRQPLTIKHRDVVGTNDDGDDVIDFVGDGDEVFGYLTRGAFGQGLFGAEDTADRETYTSDWILVLPAETAITARDQVVYGEQMFEVSGEPHRVWSPRLAREHHVEVRLQETVG